MLSRIVSGSIRNGEPGDADLTSITTSFTHQVTYAEFYRAADQRSKRRHEGGQTVPFNAKSNIS